MSDVSELELWDIEEYRLLDVDWTFTARLIAEIRRHRAARLTAEECEALRRVRERFAYLLSASPVDIAVLDRLLASHGKAGGQ